ncbi:MAG: HNH endonuclease [Bacteroidales bacterium]|nr:HNH endonuclease [Bacteroidales bacterium]MCF8336695.1 HNH endonuclease [Bacteroidales bacterium]
MKTKDLKLLWGKAAGRCSICKQNLVMLMDNVVIGEMAHVIAKSHAGPRGKKTNENNATYDNLILLCPNHHTEIDKNPSKWNVKKLKQIKEQHELWVKEQLEAGEIDFFPYEALNKINRIIERSNILSSLLWADIGNARYLYAMQEDENFTWFKLHDDKYFRDGFLDLLDNLYYKNQDNTPPFVFSNLNALILFPEGFEKYQNKFINPIVEKPEVPLLLENINIVKKKDNYLYEVKKITPLPNLPLECGFITGIDENTHMPISISDKPCEKYLDAYYWVKPTGLRTVIFGIGVTDPLECYYGQAIWWRPEDARPFIGVRAVKRVTKESLRELEKFKKKIYSEMIKKFEGKKWNNKNKKFE